MVLQMFVHSPDSFSKMFDRLDLVSKVFIVEFSGINIGMGIDV